MTRIVRRSALLGMLAALTLLIVVPLAASPASAHNDLRSSTPSTGDKLTAAPPSVTLVFAEKADPKFLKVAVTGADSRSIAKGAPQVDQYRVIQPIEVTATGQYTLSYRVVSVDGHPVQGTVKFSVTLPVASASPSPSVSPTQSPSGAVVAQPKTSNASNEPADEHTAQWPYYVIGLFVLALVGIGIMLATSKRSDVVTVGQRDDGDGSSAER